MKQKRIRRFTALDAKPGLVNSVKPGITDFAGMGIILIGMAVLMTGGNDPQ